MATRGPKQGGERRARAARAGSGTKGATPLPSPSAKPARASSAPKPATARRGVASGSQVSVAKDGAQAPSPVLPQWIVHGREDYRPPSALLIRACDAWVEAMQRRSDNPTIGLIASVAMLIESAVRRADTHLLHQFQVWVYGPDPQVELQHARQRQSPDLLAALGGDGGPVLAWARAADAWVEAARRRPHDPRLAQIAIAVVVAECAIRREDWALLERMWTWTYGPVPTLDDLHVSEPNGQRLARPEYGVPSNAVSQTAGAWIEAARRRPHDRLTGLVAAIMRGLARTIGREDRVDLRKAREACCGPVPAAEVLRIRGIEAPNGLLAKLADDAPVRSLLAASDDWIGAAWSQPDDPLINDTAAIVAAVECAIRREDAQELTKFKEWAYDYLERRQIVLPSHDRAVRAGELVGFLQREFETYLRKTGAQPDQDRWWWSKFVLDAANLVAISLPECFRDQDDLSAVFNAMQERLYQEREHTRLQAVHRTKGAEALGRAVAVSALKANPHTERFADNLFAFERGRRARRKGD